MVWCLSLHRHLLLDITQTKLGKNIKLYFQASFMYGLQLRALSALLELVDSKDTEALVYDIDFLKALVSLFSSFLPHMRLF